MIDYMDNDVAYLLGLIIGRGVFSELGDTRRLLIHFPFELMQVRGIPGSRLRFDQKKEIRLCLDDARRRLNELLEVNVDIETAANEITLKAIFTKATMSWRNLKMLCYERLSFHEFEIPEILYQVPADLQVEFLRGIADSTASPSYSDRDQAGNQRIVLQFNNLNWRLPIQVCRLLQECLNVKVQHVLFGHPNIRTSSRRTSQQWAKEHRLRIFAEDFESIGFNFPYKQQIFAEMVEYNKRNRRYDSKKCNPQIKKIRSKKPRHPAERDSRLPREVRKHFNAAFEICMALGCRQGEPNEQKKPIISDEENE
jgi:hypothetical protein